VSLLHGTTPKAITADWRVALRERLRFLLANMRGLLFWPVVAILMAVLGWALLFVNFREDRNDAAAAALAKAAVIAKGHAAHLKRTMDNIDQIVLLVKEQWESSNGKLKLENFKKKGLFPESAPFNVSIVNRHGIRQTSTFGAAANSFLPDVSDREYFQAQKAATTDFLFYGLPTIGRMTGNAIIQFSRRLTDKDRNFDGVVLLTVRTDYFTSDYYESSLGKQGLLGVIGVDDIVRVIRIGNTVFPPQSKALRFVPSISEKNGSMLLSGDQWFADKRSRYVAWEFVEGYSLIAVAGLDEQETLAPYWTARTKAIHAGTGATAILAAFMLIAMGLSLRLTWRRKELERIRATYRMATEGGSEGFFMARPIRDFDKVITDFEAVDCNERGAAFFNFSREYFIGRKVSWMQNQKAAAVILHLLLQAMEQGQYEGELELSSGERERTRSVHLKAVRSGDSLAVAMRDITREKEHVRELELRGNQDVLTGLPNRLWVTSYIPEAITRAVAKKALLAVLFIDLDGFKTINDTLGHAAGDEVLRNVARRLQEAVRPKDHVVRLGGDEFLVIIENIFQETDAAHVAERVLQAFEANFSIAQGVASIGTSIGISVYPLDATNGDTLLQNSDIAMYAAKTSGKHRYQFFDRKFYDALRERLAMEAALAYAIEHDQFVMHYQPRIDMSTGTTSSMEALVRWVHPSKGLVEPSEFIPLAEANGLILDLGKLIINKVCEQMEQWALGGESLVPVSINVSSRQFNESNIATTLVEALKKHAVDPSLIEIELTESTMMGNTEKISNALSTIHDLGIKLLVDDFGTGYSSLSQLQTLDFDLLKVDRAFTSELGKTSRGNIFFSAIITMAHALGMRVVAEGVETESQFSLLKSLHCDEIQGFYISHPVGATAAQHGLYQKLALPP
jgi:diguanylate cyclase (GGDEF)-like protein